MHSKNVKAETEWGGLIYAYDSNIVRMWVPGFTDVGMILYPYI